MTESDRKPLQSKPKPPGGPDMPQSPVDPATGRIAGDLPCIGCEYKLCTLRADSRCTECGKEVADSIRKADPKVLQLHWITGLKGGFDVLFLGMLILSIAATAILIFVVTRNFVFRLLVTTAIAYSFLGLFMLAVGTFAVIGARPSPRAGRGLHRTRSVFLAGIPGTVMLIISAIILSPIWWVSASVAMLAVACAGSIPISFSYYCCQLAFRYPTDRLRKTATVGVWATALCMSTLVIQLFMLILEEAWEISIDTRMGSTPFIVAAITFLGELPLYIVIFYKLLAAIREELNRFPPAPLADGRGLPADSGGGRTCDSSGSA